ncbi:hypothetical protein B1218_36255, partial [Pseudomonas ogarae]
GGAGVRERRVSVGRVHAGGWAGGVGRWGGGGGGGGALGWGVGKGGRKGGGAGGGSMRREGQKGLGGGWRGGVLADGWGEGQGLEAWARPGSVDGTVLDRLVRGTDMRVLHGLTRSGGDGLIRACLRAKLWEDDRATYGDIVLKR